MLCETDLWTLAGAYLGAHSYVSGHTMNSLLTNQGDIATLRHVLLTMQVLA